MSDMRTILCLMPPPPHTSFLGWRSQVTPAQHMESVMAMQPEMFVSLADEVDASATQKRIAQSVERTTGEPNFSLSSSWGGVINQPTGADVLQHTLP